MPEIAELSRRAVENGTLQPGSAAASFLLQIVRNLSRMKVGSDGKMRRHGCRYSEQAMNIFQVLLHYGGPRVINFLQVNNRAPTSNTVTVSNYVKKVTVSNYVKKASFQTASCKAQLNADAWWVSLCESLRPFAANHGGLLAAILCELEDECFILFIYCI